MADQPPPYPGKLFKHNELGVSLCCLCADQRSGGAWGPGGQGYRLMHEEVRVHVSVWFLHSVFPCVSLVIVCLCVCANMANVLCSATLTASVSVTTWLPQGVCCLLFVVFCFFVSFHFRSPTQPTNTTNNRKGSVQTSHSINNNNVCLFVSQAKQTWNKNKQNKNKTNRIREPQPGGWCRSMGCNRWSWWNLSSARGRGQRLHAHSPVCFSLFGFCCCCVICLWTCVDLVVVVACGFVRWSWWRACACSFGPSHSTVCIC